MTRDDDSLTPFLALEPQTRKRSPRKWALSALASLLVVAAIFMFIRHSTSHVSSTSLSANGGVQYALTNVESSDSFIRGILVLQSGAGPYGNDLSNLKFEALFDSNDRLRVHIYDPSNQRWEVPASIVDVENGATGVQGETAYKLTYTASPFSFSVVRLDTNEVIFQSVSFIFENQYLELTTALPANPNIYGLGERIHPLRMDTNNKAYTLFAKDQGTPYDDGTGGKNIYASHPFYMELRNGKAHGVFMLNSHAMDVYLSPTSLTYKMIGGVMDLFFFLGPEPETVIRQYHSLIGQPFLPPYWGLGFHQCRWGYKTVEQTQAVADNYRKNNLPLDTMWNDIDYMDRYQDFTSDETAFSVPKMQKFIQNLKSNGQHYIMIVDAGIAKMDYFAFNEGVKRDIFLKNAQGENLVGKVWPGYAMYPDFMHPEAAKYWSDMFTIFQQWIPFDGVWLDMNEVSNFCDGACTDVHASSSSSSSAALRVAKGVFDPEHPPYLPGGQDLNIKTASMSAKHYSGLEYDVHNLFGFLETKATADFMHNVMKKRSMIISRSTFPGHGRNGGHWLGDNTATWDDLHLSISGVLNFQMFGIPLVGADICGFAHDTTPELCARWMALGSLYPFSRNHNDDQSMAQEPYALGDMVLSVSRKFLQLRYSLLPFMYTQFYNVHVNGGTVWQPLFFEFPADPAVVGIDRQFMIGHSLLATPVLTQGATSVRGYLPAGLWYDFFSGEVIGSTSAGQWVDMQAPIDTLPLHILGGSIVPRQDPVGALTTRDARTKPFQLLVALCSAGQAAGSLFADDEDIVGTVQQKAYLEVQYTVKENTLSAVVINNGYDVMSSRSLNTITVYGVNGHVQSAAMADNGHSNGNSVAFKQSGNVVVFSVSTVMNQDFELSWTF